MIAVVLVRSARADDIDAILALWATSAGPTRLPGNRASVARLIERDAGALLVAEDRDEIVGTLIVGWDGWRCHLYRLAVSAEHRRRGIAALLVDHARARARDLGARRLDAMVDDDNDLGRNFWSGVGFTYGPAEDRRWTSEI